MKKNSIVIPFLLFVMLTGSCVLPYEFEALDFDRVIVVDGVVSTEFKKHYVDLSYTVPISSDTPAALEGANVWVENSNGTIFAFNEVAPGHYLSEIEFAADTENEYQLFFRSDAGRLYQSTKNKPIPASPIDSIYDRYAELIQANSTVQDIGIQFFLDSSDPSGMAKNFRYEWEETYKIVTPYKSFYDYDESLNEIIQRETPIDVCYSTNISKSLIIGTSVGASVDRMVEFPIQFVSGDNDILRNRYSILVRQFSVSNETYNYYQQIKATERQGSLFDEQQGSVIGNIASVNDPNEVVLGNFEVSGVSSLRVFFDFGELDDKFLYPGYRYRCLPEELIYVSVEDAITNVKANTYNIIDVIPPEFGPPVVTMVLDLCSDCTEFSTNVKPDFWIDG